MTAKDVDAYLPLLAFASEDNAVVENMVMLMAGRAGAANPGEHVNGNRAHPPTVLVGAMQADGYQRNSLGDVPV